LERSAAQGPTEKLIIDIAAAVQTRLANISTRAASGQVRMFDRRFITRGRRQDDCRGPRDRDPVLPEWEFLLASRSGPDAYDSNGIAIAAKYDWPSIFASSKTNHAVGLAPTSPLESAIFTTLHPDLIQRSSPERRRHRNCPVEIYHLPRQGYALRCPGHSFDSAQDRLARRFLS